LAANSDIISAAIVSLEGIPIASTLPQDIDEILFAGMCTAIQSISKQAVKELHRGQLKCILIEGVNELIIVSKAGENAILVVATTNDANLNSIPFSLFKDHTDSSKDKGAPEIIL